MNEENRYHYELPIRAAVVVFVFYLGLFAWMAYLAWIWSEATRICFIALSVIFFTLAVVSLVRRIAFPCTLELTDDSILLPRGHLWVRITTIPYVDIISLKGGDSLTVEAGSGSFWIGAFRFEGYSAVRELISVKTAIALEPSLGKHIGTRFKSDYQPVPLVQWLESRGFHRRGVGGEQEFTHLPCFSWPVMLPLTHGVRGERGTQRFALALALPLLLFARIRRAKRLKNILAFDCQVEIDVGSKRCRDLDL